MDYFKLIVSALVGGVIALMLFMVFAHNAAPTQGFGATAANVTTITNPWTFTKAVSAAAVTLSGALTVTTTNTATSTVAAGCYQLTATSTANPMKLVVSNVSTTTVTFGNGTVGFPVIAVYGTCP